MPPRPLRPSSAAAAIVLVAAAWLATPRGQGQPPEKVDAPPRLRFQVYPAAQCVNCHKGDNTAYSQIDREDMICRLTEWYDYDGRDRHQVAYESLRSPRSREMVRALGWKDADGTTARACLNCHALPAPDGEPEQTRDILAEGVSCNACHGPYFDWFAPHSVGVFDFKRRAGRPRGDRDLLSWIDLSRDEKEQRYGMTDLWNPVRRAELCASCHVGNLQEKKVVTHAMYAAGHPPLPGFEPSKFSDNQPKHWEYLREKSPKRQARLKPFDPSNLERAELVAVGGLVTLRESMRLLAAQARANKDEPTGAAWPDLARFDCQACHHELKTAEAPLVSREPAAVPRRAPGRPGEPTWPHALAWFGIQALGKDPAAETKEYQRLTAELSDAFGARPFGDRERVIKAADALAAWSDRVLKDRQQRPLDAAAVRTLLVKLCEYAESGNLDYDRARQCAFALSTVYEDYSQAVKAPPGAAEVRAALQVIDAQLLLKPAHAGNRSNSEDALRAWLNVAAAYDPVKVRDAFRAAREALSK